MITSFYSREELNEIGFKKIGDNVKISRNAMIYGAENMVIGNNVRIDDFCVLSGKVVLGNYIHIAVYSAIFAGKTGVIMQDFCGLSSQCAIYAESDDYSGKYLTNPTVDDAYLGIIAGQVTIEKHAVIGTGTTVFPGVTIGEGTAVGAKSLVNKSLEGWGIYAGVPCKLIKERTRELLELEKKFLKERNR